MRLTTRSWAYEGALGHGEYAFESDEIKVWDSKEMFVVLLCWIEYSLRRIQWHVH